MITLQQGKFDPDDYDSLNHIKYIELTNDQIDEVESYQFESILYTLEKDIDNQPFIDRLQALALERLVPFGTMELAPSGT